MTNPTADADYIPAENEMESEPLAEKAVLVDEEPVETFVVDTGTDEASDPVVDDNMDETNNPVVGDNMNGAFGFVENDNPVEADAPVNEDNMEEQESDPYQEDDGYASNSDDMESVRSEEPTTAQSNRDTKYASVSESRMRTVRYDNYQDRLLVEERKKFVDIEDEQNWGVIVNAQQKKHVLRDATIIGADELEMGDETIPVALVSIMGFIGYISYDEVWVRMPARLTRALQKEGFESFKYRAKGMIAAMSGCKIPVIIKEAYRDPGGTVEFAIVASRRMALLLDIEANYRHPDDPNPSKLAVKEGAEVAATVTGCFGRMVMLNLRGIDIVANKNTLTYRYAANAEDLFHKGDRVLVRVNKIVWPTEPEFNQHFYNDADVRMLTNIIQTNNRRSAVYRNAKRDLAQDRVFRVPLITINGRIDEAIAMYKKRRNYLHKNAIYCAVINRITETSGLPVYWLYLPDLGLMGKGNQIKTFNMITLPKEGDYVQFKFDGTVTRYGALQGQIIGYLGQ